MNISALKYKYFRIHLAGKVFALNSLWMLRMTFGWIAWDSTGSASFVGLIAFLHFAPTLIVGPLFGVLIDRVRVKFAAMVTQSLLFVLTLTLYFAFTRGLLNPALLVLLAGISGVITSAHNPVRMSLAPRLVAPDAITSVITIVAIMFNLARLTGPALGGWIIASWGIDTCLMVQTIGYVPFIFALSLLRPRERSDGKSKPEGFLQALATGVRYATREPVIRRALMITALVAFVNRGVLEILPVIADGIFQKGAGGLGILASVAGFGALIAGLVRAVSPHQVAGILPRPPLVIGLIGMALVPVVGQSGTWEFTIALIAWLGFSATTTAITMQTAVQIGLSDELRGRVMSLWTMTSMGAASLGVFVLGGLTDQFGFANTLILMGGLGFVLLVLVIRKELSSEHALPTE
ncbi:MAG: MFS transporter [Paracoccaceae bacterium]